MDEIWKDYYPPNVSHTIYLSIYLYNIHNKEYSTHIYLQRQLDLIIWTCIIDSKHVAMQVSCEIHQICYN